MPSGSVAPVGMCWAMWPEKGVCSAAPGPLGLVMSPAEDAQLLLTIVRRHLRTLRLGLDPAYPAEDWGFTAQQAVEKILKAWIVLANRQPPPRS